MLKQSARHTAPTVKKLSIFIIYLRGDNRRLRAGAGRSIWNAVRARSGAARRQLRKTEAYSVHRILVLLRLALARSLSIDLSWLRSFLAEHTMGKIRHIAIQVPDLEKAAAFYEGVFELERVNQVESPIGNAISLSDGIMNLTLLHFPEGTQGRQRRAGLGRPASHRLRGRGRESDRKKDRGSRRRILHAVAELSGRRRRKEIQGHQRHRVRRFGA